MDLRVGSGTLETWHKGSGPCTHRLLPATAVNQYSTNETDLPGKTVWRQRDRERRERWARCIGPDMTGELQETADGGWVRGGDYYANMGR